VPLKNLSRITLAFVLAAVLPSQTSAFRQLDPLAAQRAGIEDGPRVKMERDMAKKANQARQADLKRDTEKLLKLATELKESVDKTSESTLSLDVIKKAEEIEKLAHSVKDKMKAPY
jgi:Skp family chaperone for outer membrane proteins